ncbi:dihydroorotase [Candidatus Peregrinibacteria bacterium CG10_big_fil_rev_8_21_14_0_10_49_16]|nr:MAG: dihydroorotase [Candidatus Peregrinibacteria bacterium CG22_combo_CG10-13_8_21_14_all_49_11]PIR51896.1 MAG: dihydroorotase [Candidatus Peregrinibacteria bacterium CG10_big_fil_rev_8_21_14_0_10_49_16]
MTTFTMRRLDDMHCHFRTGALLEEVLPWTVRYAGRAIAMPNTRPRAILTADDVVWYRDQILRVRDAMPVQYPFEPLMTIEIRDSTTPQMVMDAYRVGAVAGKVYPLGVTTNSDEGLRDFFSTQIQETFRAMRGIGMLLLMHGELDKPRTLVTKREHVFLPVLCRLVDMFPDLRMVLEHISTKEAVELVWEFGPNVAATITAHHLYLTLNDVIGDGIRPHNGCMPMPKDFSDRDALIEAAMSGNPKFFLGSDSAPHPREKKECARGACGDYTAPHLPELLATKFEEHGKLNRLDGFGSRFGAEFYGLPLNEGKITLTQETWCIPEQCGMVVPFRAGLPLRWQLV